MIEIKTIVLDRDVLALIPMIASPEAHRQIGLALMEGARDMIIQKAGQRLNSTRMDYIQGLQPLELEPSGVALILMGSLPNMVEHGWDGDFLHDTLLGDNAKGWKTSAEGYRYRAIPFSHKQPGAANDQGGQRMGRQFLPKNAPAGNMSSGERLQAAQAALIGKKIKNHASRLITKGEKALGKKGKTRLPEGLAPKLKPHHVTDIYAGMQVQKQGTSSGKDQKTYTTFRMISENVPGSWYHPGIAAHNFFDEIGPYIEKMAPGAVEAYVKGLQKK